jgi:hypothetical protein
MLFAAAARAEGCIELPYADARSLQSLSFQDPKRALEAIRKALATAQSGNPIDSHHVAALYAAQAESYGLLELDADARSAALAGLQLVPEPTDPVRLALQAEESFQAASTGVRRALRQR